ncbi:hypothetical protein LIER_11067 [Lithospermum erythrorhizon]|uniref:SPRY domain-containing protein n=1 Tax=Lithospermum erythrorhizon TaxID=34254 RepID=A0AAV3PRS8_LITER
MLRWLEIGLVAASIVLVFVILLSFILHRVFHKKKHAVDDVNLQESGQNFETGISRLPHVSIHDTSIDQDNLNFTKKKTSNYFVLRRGFSGKNSLFSWQDHPSLVADAVENGWSSFAFSPIISSSQSRSLLGSCVVSENQSIRDMDIETSWEICQQGSADFGQILRFHSQELKKKISTNHVGFFSVIKTSLPLPGPSLGNISSFPQESYFEITILSLHHHNVTGQELSGKVKGDHEGDKIKLMEEDYNAKTNYSSESLIHVSSTHRYGDKEIDEMKHARKENEKVEASIILSVGLTAAGGGGGTVPIKLPGSYPGSIGFYSNGSVFLDGIKLVLESPMQEWEKPEKVIGCGYNPSKGKVYFTIDSQLIHEIHCKSNAFSTPLYPTLASNADITVLVNLGQSTFNYEPANLQRTSNPSFIGPLEKSPTLGFDSGELFSMRRVDSHQWLNRNATRSTANGTVGRGLDYDEESDGDLFEITLERPGKSPYTYQ